MESLGLIAAIFFIAVFISPIVAVSDHPGLAAGPHSLARVGPTSVRSPEIHTR